MHENEVAPTCTTDGSYDEVVYCSDCGEQLSRTTEKVSALGHNYDSGKITTQPTCSTTGWRRYTCTICSTYNDVKLAALGHDYSYDHYGICLVCGEFNSVKIIGKWICGSNYIVVKSEKTAEMILGGKYYSLSLAHKYSNGYKAYFYVNGYSSEQIIFDFSTNKLTYITALNEYTFIKS